jgi:hypothetical protein
MGTGTQKEDFSCFDVKFATKEDSRLQFLETAKARQLIILTQDECNLVA